MSLEKVLTPRALLLFAEAQLSPRRLHLTGNFPQQHS
jgi:hypothetical protein